MIVAKRLRILASYEVAGSRSEYRFVLNGQWIDVDVAAAL